MSTQASTTEPYSGFEQGPIRPPSEANSLLLRVSRNCPWNKCTFCGLYKGQQFSRRPLAHVLEDIKTVQGFVEQLRNKEPVAVDDLSWSEQLAYYAARTWVLDGCQSVFLQDSNSLIIKPRELITILEALRSAFPKVDRITSYARSQTIARMPPADLAAIAAAGLNRIHIGLESGSDAVLAFVKKGADALTHVKAGVMVKEAGIELSEYYMPGLGGEALSQAHAQESAAVLNQINPDFIRLRTLALPDSLELTEEQATGRFQKLGDRQTAEELHLFLRSLSGITSQVKSDHILNLFEEIDGRLPDDQAAMLGVIDTFLALPPEEQVLYQIGRRCGVFHALADLRHPALRARALHYVEQWMVTQENVDQVCDQLMQRFI
nr:radical SAM protein [uncultured Desulfobulbus sp.]